MSAPDLGPSWDRFVSSHLGDWAGRSLALSPAGRLLRSEAYALSTTSVAPLKSNPAFVLVSATVTADGADPTAARAMDARYDAADLHVFDDGSYTAKHRLLALPHLPDGTPAAPVAIEHTLSLSATERARVFLAYDADGALDSVVLLEEARHGLFENRSPLSLTSLVGAWEGTAETLQRPEHDTGSKGFGPGAAAARRAAAAAARARQAYSKEDLPDELKHPSAGAAEGLLRFQTSVSYGWDPAAGTVRRTTRLRDMQGVDLGQSVVHGSVASEEGAIFDVVRLSTDESVLLTLSNASYVSAPLRVHGKVTTSELGCLVTPACRRRISRTNAVWGCASESLVTESLSRM